MIVQNSSPIGTNCCFTRYSLFVQPNCSKWWKMFLCISSTFSCWVFREDKIYMFSPRIFSVINSKFLLLFPLMKDLCFSRLLRAGSGREPSCGRKGAVKSFGIFYGCIVNPAIFKMFFRRKHFSASGSPKLPKHPVPDALDHLLWRYFTP